MKKHSINRSNPHATKRHTKEVLKTDGEDTLNQTAEELNTLARMRFPDGGRYDILTGYESDIRQDAVLLALEWYLRQKTHPESHPKYPWHAPRAIAEALRIQKRDYSKALKKEAKALRLFPVEQTALPQHPSLMRTCEWPASTMQTVIRAAIRIALRNRRISHVNAVVGLGVIIDGIPAREMADRLGVTRSAIYQNLGRVRREIPDIIDGIEVPLNHLF